MINKIQDAFDAIQADEVLIKQTAAYLHAERIKRQNKTRRFPPLRLSAALAAIFVLFFGTFAYNTYESAAVTYVGIDVNPSVELTLNRRDKVIAAQSFNAAGADLLIEANIHNKEYGEAIAALLAIMEREGYFTDYALVTMTVHSSNEAKEQLLCDTLRQSVNGQITAKRSATVLEVFPVSLETRKAAHECHVSAAKYLAIQDLLEVDETATLESYRKSTIRQIRQRTQQCRSEHGNPRKHGYHGGE